METQHNLVNTENGAAAQYQPPEADVPEQNSKRRKVGEEGGDAVDESSKVVVSELSAAQIINMAAEMLTEVQKSSAGQNQSNAGGMLRMCFADRIVVTALDSKNTLVSGRDLLITSLVNSVSAPAAPPVSEPVARVVFEGRDGTAPSFALDLYGSKISPMAYLKGGSSSVLSRARKCQLDHIWAGDIAALAKDQLLASTGWEQVLAMVKSSVEGETVYTVTYNNYMDTVDPSGLGIGSVSKSETWEVTVGERAIGDGEIGKALEAFGKVTKHLGNDAKFKKAAPLLLQMLSSHLLPPTCPVALAAIKAAFGSGERASADATKDAVASIVKVAWEKRDVLCGEGSVDRRVLECWQLHCTLPKRLQTDDSFAFAKAAKEVQVALEGWNTSCTGGGEGEEEVGRYKAVALFSCVQQMVRMYQFQWARAPVDMCFKVLVDPKKRALFGAKKSALEDLINTLQRKKKGAEKHDSQGHYQASGFQHGKMGW